MEESKIINRIKESIDDIGPHTISSAFLIERIQLKDGRMAEVQVIVTTEGYLHKLDPWWDEVNTPSTNGDSIPFFIENPEPKEA